MCGDDWVVKDECSRQTIVLASILREVQNREWNIIPKENLIQAEDATLIDAVM